MSPSPAAPSKREGRDHRQRGTAQADLDEDELDMLNEEDEDEEQAGLQKQQSKASGTIVTRQPSIVVGGEMRYYFCLNVALDSKFA